MYQKHHPRQFGKVKRFFLYMLPKKISVDIRTGFYVKAVKFRDNIYVLEEGWHYTSAYVQRGFYAVSISLSIAYLVLMWWLA